MIPSAPWEAWEARVPHSHVLPEDLVVRKRQSVQARRRSRRRPPTDRRARWTNRPPRLPSRVRDGRHPPRAVPVRPAGPQWPRSPLAAPSAQWWRLGWTEQHRHGWWERRRQQPNWPGHSRPRLVRRRSLTGRPQRRSRSWGDQCRAMAMWRRNPPEARASPARRRLGREVSSSGWLVTRRWGAPDRASCPSATGPRPVGRLPRLGRVEIRLGPAWVRYRETATPETDPPSTSRRPVLVPGRHRERSSRLWVTLPRCPPAAMPTAPIYPARLRLFLRGLRFCVAGAIPVRPGACSGIRPCVLLGPALPHRVAD